MTRTTTLIGTVVAFTIMGTGAAMAADCGAKPAAPALPADGSKLASKEMDALAKEMDGYSTKFSDFNKCIINEYNESQKKFDEVVDGYAAKNKKK